MIVLQNQNKTKNNMQNERKQNKTYHWFGFGVISQLLWKKQTKQVRKQQTKQTQTMIGRLGVANKK